MVPATPCAAGAAAVAPVHGAALYSPRRGCARNPATQPHKGRAAVVLPSHVLLDTASAKLASSRRKKQQQVHAQAETQYGKHVRPNAVRDDGMAPLELSEDTDATALRLALRASAPSTSIGHSRLCIDVWPSRPSTEPRADKFAHVAPKYLRSARVPRWHENVYQTTSPISARQRLWRIRPVTAPDAKGQLLNPYSDSQRFPNAGGLGSPPVIASIADEYVPSPLPAQRFPTWVNGTGSRLVTAPNADVSLLSPSPVWQRPRWDGSTVSQLVTAPDAEKQMQLSRPGGARGRPVTAPDAGALLTDHVSIPQWPSVGSRTGSRLVTAPDAQGHLQNVLAMTQMYSLGSGSGSRPVTAPDAEGMWRGTYPCVPWVGQGGNLPLTVTASDTKEHIFEVSFETLPVGDVPAFGDLFGGDSLISIGATSSTMHSSAIADGRPFRLAEAGTSIEVTLEDGVIELFPARQWLVLEPRPQLALLNYATHNEVHREEVQLAEMVGRGSISAEMAGFLRPVGSQRLHVLAAEANFRKAGRGTSLLALQHAGFALHLLQGIVPENPRHGLPSPPLLAVTATSPGSSMACPSVEKLHKMHPIVSAQAAARAKRAAEAERVKEKAKDMPRQEAEELIVVPRNKLDLAKGIKAFREFVEFANRRYGNLVRAWFAMDPEENMKLGEKLFLRRCLDIGFTGNAVSLWRYIDADRSSSIKLWEIDPASTLLLASFKKLVTEHFGDSLDKTFFYFDDNHSGRIHRNEFVPKIKKFGFTGPAGRLFDSMDRDGMGSIEYGEFHFLDKWVPEPYLLSEPDFEALDGFKSALIRTHGSPLFKSWRKVLDKDGTMRASWEKFLNAWRGIRQMPGVAKSEVEVAAVWRALDTDCSGWISIREYDQECGIALREFKLWADKAYGGVVAAFRAADYNSNGKLSVKELSKVANEDKGYMGDVAQVFAYLDVNDAWTLLESDVAFLDKWELLWEEWEMRAKKEIHRFGQMRPTKRKP